MVSFTTIDELDKYINDEKKTKKINLVRYINVNSFNIWTELVSRLRYKTDKTIALSDYCEGSELTPNLSRIKNAIEEVETTTLLLPLSEHLRLVKREEPYLQEYVKIDHSTEKRLKNIRIYIPMYRMKNLLMQLSKTDLRIKDSFLFLESPEDEDYSITIINRNLKTPLSGDIANGYKEYLNAWEQNPRKPLYFYTIYADNFCSNVISDNIKVLNSSFDVLAHFYNFEDMAKRIWGKDSQWDRLLDMLEGKDGLIPFLKDMFQLSAFLSQALLEKWNEVDDFGRWLILVWMKIESKSKYLAMVLKDDRLTADTFIEALVNSIYSIEHPCHLDIYYERKELLKKLKLDSLPSSFWEIYETKPIDEKPLYLTDATFKERVETVDVFGKMGLTESNLKKINNAYPALHAYLNDYIFAYPIITDYFREYKKQKIENRIYDSFIGTVRSLAAKKGVWYDYFESRNKLVDEIYDANTIIYWVDGLGVEYLGLIEYLLKTFYSSTFYDIKVGYANLPTVTENNKDFIEGREVIEYRDLDELKHNYRCKYPSYIAKEFDMIQLIVKKAINLLQEGNKILITSDHGASRLAVVFKEETHKPRHSSICEKWGRYCKDSNHDYGNEINGCIDYQEYHVFADYDRFSASGGPKGEIHGGASLEEVLVPLIQLSKETFRYSAISLKVLTPELTLKAGQKPKVMFKLDKDIDKVCALIQGKRYECVQEKGHWYLQPSLGRGNVFEVLVLSGEKTIGEFTFKVKKGISTEFDI